MVDIARQEIQRLRVYYQEYLLQITRHEMEIEDLNKKWKNIERIYASFGMGTKSQGELKKGRVFREIEQEIEAQKSAIDEVQKFLNGEDGIQGKFVQAIQNNNMTGIEQLAKSTDCVAAKFVYACSLYSKDRAEATKFLKACETDREYYGNLVKAVPFLFDFSEKDYSVRIQPLKSEKSSGRIKAEAAKIQEEFSALRKSMQDLLQNDVIRDDYKHHFDEIESQIIKWEEDLKKIIQEAEVQEQRVRAARREAKENRRNSFKITIMNVAYGIVLIYLIAIRFPGCVKYWEGRTSFFTGSNTVITNLLPVPCNNDIVLDSDYKFPVIFLKNPQTDTLVLQGDAAEKPVIMLVGHVNSLTVKDYEGESYVVPIECDYVYFESCPNLQSISDLSNAGGVEITNCPNLQSISDLSNSGRIEITNCQNLQSIEFPESMYEFSIEDCPNLQSISNLSNTERVGITNCQDLQSITNLSNNYSVAISGCPNLQSITNFSNNYMVEIYGCPKLQSIEVLGSNNVRLSNALNLQSVDVDANNFHVSYVNGSNLESIVVPEGVTSVTIDTCPNLQSIVAPETLNRVSIYDCPNLNDINCLNPDCTISRD